MTETKDGKRRTFTFSENLQMYNKYLLHKFMFHIIFISKYFFKAQWTGCYSVVSQKRFVLS